MRLPHSARLPAGWWGPPCQPAPGPHTFWGDLHQNAFGFFRRICRAHRSPPQRLALPSEQPLWSLQLIVFILPEIGLFITKYEPQVLCQVGGSSRQRWHQAEFWIWQEPGLLGQKEYLLFPVYSVTWLGTAQETQWLLKKAEKLVFFLLPEKGRWLRMRVSTSWNPEKKNSNQITGKAPLFNESVSFIFF